MDGKNQQIAAQSSFDGLSGRTRNAAPYAHRFSPKKFTQPQLFAALVLKEFLRLDYRKLAALLADTADLRRDRSQDSTALHHLSEGFAPAAALPARPTSVGQDDPHRGQATTPWPAASSWPRWTARVWSRTTPATIMSAVAPKAGQNWQNITYRRFPKAGILCDCRSHLILAVVPGRGPRSDMRHFRAALDQALRRVRIATLIADAGYDSEELHAYAREQRGSAHADSAADRSSDEKASLGLLATTNGGAFGAQPICSTLAGGNRQQYAQATARRGPPSTPLLDSVP